MNQMFRDVYPDVPVPKSIWRWVDSAQYRLAAVGAVRALSVVDLLICGIAAAGDLVVLHDDAGYELAGRHLPRPHNQARRKRGALADCRWRDHMVRSAHQKYPPAIEPPPARRRSTEKPVGSAHFTTRRWHRRCARCMPTSRADGRSTRWQERRTCRAQPSPRRSRQKRATSHWATWIRGECIAQRHCSGIPR
jgi:hypothetical protein